MDMFIENDIVIEIDNYNYLNIIIYINTLC